MNGSWPSSAQAPRYRIQAGRQNDHPHSQLHSLRPHQCWSLPATPPSVKYAGAQNKVNCTVHSTLHDADTEYAPYITHHLTHHFASTSAVNCQVVNRSDQPGRPTTYTTKQTNKMEISNPRRILAVSLTSSAQHLSNVIKGKPLTPTISSILNPPSLAPPSTTSPAITSNSIPFKKHRPNRHLPHLPTNPTLLIRNRHSSTGNANNRRHNPPPSAHHALLHGLGPRLARPGLFSGRLGRVVSLARGEGGVGRAGGRGCCF